MKFIRLSKLILIFLLIPILASCQSFKFITEIDDKVDESSGLIHLRNKLITHNDSGGKASLYEIDSLTGVITRVVKINDANNVDWEDICHDDEFIYIADIGNNNGNRKDLKIYKISIDEYFNTKDNTVESEEINISYEDQEDFTTRNRAHNFDAETLISYEDSLYIFTKNWVDLKSRVYPLSKKTESQVITSKGSLDVKGLITGGVYEPISNTIWLSGYQLFVPFVIKLSHFENTDFENGLMKKKNINTVHSRQIESIASKNDKNFYLTGERDRTGTQSLYSFNSDIYNKTSFINKDLKYIYPNPTTSILHIEKSLDAEVEVYSINGKLILKTISNTVDVSDLSNGVYYIRVKNNTTKESDTYSFIKK